MSVQRPVSCDRKKQQNLACFLISSMTNKTKEALWILRIPAIYLSLATVLQLLA